MGFYINDINGEGIGVSFEQKCENLQKHGAEEVSGDEFKENLVVVVDNGLFAAAGYAFSEREYEVFCDPNGRRTKWFVVPDAAKHSGYEEMMKNRYVG